MIIKQEVPDRANIMKTIKWTYETCMEEAKKYSYCNEFRKNAGGAYNVAKRNNWLDDYTWFENGNINGAESRTKWTYDACYNIAKEYETSNAFKTNYPNVYSAACKKGWLKDYTWFKNGRTIASKLRIKWTREACMKEAKKYKTSSEFWNNNTSAYTIARRNGWLKDYTWFPVKKVWNYETCYEAAKECKTRTEFSKKYSRGYNVAWQNKWLNDYTWFKKLRAS